MTATYSAPAALLSAAAAGGKPGTQQLTQALLETERDSKRQRHRLPLEALLGTWRLRYTAPRQPRLRDGQPTAGGFYMPGLATATLSFSPGSSQEEPLAIQNQLQIGAVRLRFSGPAKRLPRQNLLAFDFTRLELLVGKLTVVDRPLRGRCADFASTPVGQLPFFAFFAAAPTYLAARGRSGGLALWVKDPSC